MGKIQLFIIAKINLNLRLILYNIYADFNIKMQLLNLYKMYKTKYYSQNLI